MHHILILRIGGNVNVYKNKCERFGTMDSKKQQSNIEEQASEVGSYTLETVPLQDRQHLLSPHRNPLSHHFCLGGAEYAAVK